MGDKLIEYAEQKEAAFLSNKGGCLLMWAESLCTLCKCSCTVKKQKRLKNGLTVNLVDTLYFGSNDDLQQEVQPMLKMIKMDLCMHFFVYSVCTIGAWEAFWGNAFISASVSAIMRLLIIQFILHWSFCCLLLLFYMLTSNAIFTIAAGILISFKILNILYALVGRFTNFDLAQYMLDYNIFQTGLESTKLAYTRTAIVGVVFLLIEIMLSCLVMSKKDIK